MVISSRIMQCKICSQGLASFLTWFLCECAKKFSKSKGEKVKNFVFRILAIFQIMIVHPLTCLNLSLLETFLMVYSRQQNFNYKTHRHIYHEARTLAHNTYS